MSTTDRGISTRLTAQQEYFVNEYLVDLDANRAAKAAGFKRPPMKNQAVSEAIRAGLADRFDTLAITSERVLHEISRMAFGDPDGIEYRMSDKIKCLELLSKHLGLFTEKLEVSVKTHEDWVKTLSDHRPERIQFNDDEQPPQ